MKQSLVENFHLLRRGISIDEDIHFLQRNSTARGIFVREVTCEYFPMTATGLNKNWIFFE